MSNDPDCYIVEDKKGRNALCYIHEEHATAMCRPSDTVVPAYKVPPENVTIVYTGMGNEIESLRARLKEKDETLQELQTKLAEAEKKLKEHEEAWEKINIGGNQ